MKIRIRLPDGRIYGQTGKLDFVDNTIGQDTDLLTMRGVIPNPVVGSQSAGGVKLRELVADEFVTVLVELVKPRDKSPCRGPQSSRISGARMFTSSIRTTWLGSATFASAS